MRHTAAVMVAVLVAVAPTAALAHTYDLPKEARR